MNPNATGRALDVAVYPLLLLALLGPVFFLPGNVHDVFKVPAEAWIVGASWLLTAVIGGARALAGKPFLGGGTALVRRLGLAFVAWLLVGGLLGVRPSAHYSYVATVVAYLFAGQSVLAWIEDMPARRNYLFGLLAGLVGVEVVLGAMQTFKAPFEAWATAAPANGLRYGFFNATGLTAKDGVPIGTLGNRNYLAEFLVLTTPALIGWGFARQDRKAQVALGVLVVAALALMVACGTRAAALGFVLGAPLAALVTFGPKGLSPAALLGSAKARVAAVAVAVAAIAVVAVAGDKLVDKLERPILDDLSYQSRVMNWKAAVGIFADHPISGTGLGGWKLTNVPKLVSQNEAGGMGKLTSSRFYQAHSDPLQALAELGLIGFGLLAAMVWAWFTTLRRNEALAPSERFGLAWAVSALLIASAFGFPLHIALTAFVFVLLVAAGVAGTGEPDAPVLDEGKRLAYALAVLVLTGVVAWVAIEHGVRPLYQAAHYRWLGDQVDQKNKKVFGADVLYGLAARTDRFKAPHVFEQVQALIRRKQYAEVIAITDANKDEGLGMDALLVRAAALDGVGRKDEAIAAFKRVQAYYDPSHRNYRLATQRLERHGIAPPPTPSPTPSPTP